MRTIQLGGIVKEEPLDAIVEEDEELSARSAAAAAEDNGDAFWGENTLSLIHI